MHIYRARGAIIEWERASSSAPVVAAALWELLSRHGGRVRHWWADAAAGGTATVTDAGGIASGEAFGTAAVSSSTLASVTGAGGIASEEAFGTAAVSSNLTSSVSGAGGIASSEAFGSPAFSPTFELVGDLTRSRWRIGRKIIPTSGV